jgi:TET-associated glycosyltransferase-like protein
MRRPDFCAFILTHGRPDRVITLDTLRRCGYTGRVVIVVDNEDPTVEQYRERFEEVVVFDKAAIAAQIDEGDNFNDRRAIIYARNACFEIARELGVRYFIQLDDDYRYFFHKRDPRGNYDEQHVLDLDAVWSVMLDYYVATPRVLSIAMAQNGDFIGGSDGMNWRKPSRKAMNSFICSTDRPFKFVGRINEDVNTYASLGARGGLFLTTMHVGLSQVISQKHSGGMTELYLASGTYVKSFYSVMYQPSSVKVKLFPSVNARLHHVVNWRTTVPAILDERWKKTQKVKRNGNPAAAQARKGRQTSARAE